MDLPYSARRLMKKIIDTHSATFNNIGIQARIVLYSGPPHSGSLHNHTFKIQCGHVEPKPKWEDCNVIG